MGHDSLAVNRVRLLCSRDEREVRAVLCAPMGGGGGLENRDAVCAGKLKDGALSLQSDGNPLKAAGWGRARTRAGLQDQNPDALARAGHRETVRSRGVLSLS